MKKLVFIISHRPDNRYLKRINVLKDQYVLSMIFWNKSSEMINPIMAGIDFNEIQVIANQTNPLKRLPQTQTFIQKAYVRLCALKPDIVYVGNLDMLHIARKYKRNINQKSKIIYEIADLHRLIIDTQIGAKRILSNGLKAIEKRYLKDVDILVLTSMKFFDVYYCNLIAREKVIFLPNMPEESTFEGYKPKNRKGEPFTIGFLGWIRYKDQLRMLINAAGNVGCNVLFAGTDGEGPEFEEYCKQYSYVSFLGSFKYEEKIKELYDMIDCVYAVYDADWANVRIALPNKLYEAIDCEKPIIVAKNTYLAELVKEYGIGIDVNHKSVHDLQNALSRLMSDREYYNSLVEHCRIAKDSVTLDKYNAELIKKIETI